MRPLGLIICGILLLAYILGMKWLLLETASEYGRGAGIAGGLALLAVSLFIAWRIDARDRKNGRL